MAADADADPGRRRSAGAALKDVDALEDVDDRFDVVDFSFDDPTVQAGESGSLEDVQADEVLEVEAP